jgi:hypothetical protein
VLICFYLLSKMKLTWIFFFCFFISLLFIVGSYAILLQIHKRRYRNLWEKEKKKETFWTTYERQLYSEIAWKTPYWIKQEKDARGYLWIFRISQLLAFVFWVLTLLVIYYVFY